MTHQQRGMDETVTPQGIGAIALEVERIGEAQRFAAKLLAERPTEPANRPTPTASPAVRRVPGTITPH